jgi:hypothetical protein
MWIYSIYSPRSSIYFLARCSKFWKSLKNNSEYCTTNQVSAATLTSTTHEKLWFSIVFQSMEQEVVRRDQIEWVIKKLEVLTFQFLLGCKCQLSRVIFLQNILNKCSSRDSITPCWYQKMKARNFPAHLCTRNIGGGAGGGRGETLCRHPVDCCFAPVRSDITTIRLWLLIATGNHLDRADKIPNVSQTTNTVEIFDPLSYILGPTSRRASSCPNLREWWTQLAHVIYTVGQL